MRGWGYLAVIVIAAALPAFAQEAETFILQSPMQAFLFRSYDLFKHIRAAVIVLSAYYFIVFAWKTLVGGGKDAASSLFSAIALLATLGAAEFVVAYFLTRDGEVMVEDFEENISRLVGDVEVESIVPLAPPPDPSDEEDDEDEDEPAPEPKPAPATKSSLPTNPQKVIEEVAPAVVPLVPLAPGILGVLGKLSEKYESKGPDTINMGSRRANGDYICPPSDPGGCSYGSWQIATGRYNNMTAFLASIRVSAPDVYKRLVDAGGAAAARAGKKSFVDAWKAIARENPKRFHELQRQYIERSLFAPAMATARSRNPKHAQLLANPVVQDIMWSAAVQHGSGGSNAILSAALKASGSQDAASFIRKFYDERRAYVKYIKFSPNAREQAAMVQNLTNRFNSEQRDALRMLEQSKGKK